MISFAYLDVGGVVIDDFSGNNKWQELRQELGITQSNSEAFTKLWNQYAPELCIDRDVETLVPIFMKELGLQLPKDYSLLAGFVGRFCANPGIWPIIKRLKSKTSVGLLTNMYPGMFAAIEQKHILPDIAWDVIVDSSLELLQKPDRKLFELAESRAGVPHTEILFIDNSPEHIQEAKAFGWQTFLYDSADHPAAVRELNKFLQTQQFQAQASPVSRALSPSLIIIRGPLGVGKTTVAKLVAQSVGGAYFSVDEVLAAHKLDRAEAGKGIPLKNFLQANDFLISRIKAQQKNGQPVVVDGNFYHQAQLEDLVRKVGGKRATFTLKASLQTCVTRDRERQTSHGPDATAAVYQMVGMFDYGTIIETDSVTPQETAAVVLEALPRSIGS